MRMGAQMGVWVATLLACCLLAWGIVAAVVYALVRFA